MGYIGTRPANAPLTSADIADGVVTAPKLATDAVETAKVKDINITTAKITDLNVTNAKLGTDISAAKLTAGTVGTARLGTGTANSTTILYGDQTYKTEPAEYDDNVVQSNIAMLGFKVAVNGSLTRYNLVDQSIDEFYDASGVDASASTNEVRTASGSNFYYSGDSGSNPTGGSSTGTYSHGGVTYLFNKFTADTDFVTTSGGNADIFLIGGAGGAGADNGGGGGAGGLIWKPNHTFASSTTFAVDIGAGGDGNGASIPQNGADTTFASTTFVAKGGGAAGNGNNDGVAGGSGGGSGRDYGAGGGTGGVANQSSQAGDSGTYGFGFNGGAGRASNLGPGGGGGGTGGAGVAGTSGRRGDGGVGKSDFVNSSATETTAFLLGTTSGTDSSNVATTGASTGTLYIGGGGGGSTQDASWATAAGGEGGLGGGADSPDGAGATVGNNGLVNTGSGGGSAQGTSTDGDGGSGLLIIRYIDTAFTAVADLTLQSTDVTAEATPTYGEFVTLIENAYGTATLNTDVKGYVSRDSGVTFTQGTLVDEGTWGTNKQILGFHDLDISSQPSGTSMCYKITTHNQVASSKETRIYATSIGWR